MYISYPFTAKLEKTHRRWLLNPDSTSYFCDMYLHYESFRECGTLTQIHNSRSFIERSPNTVPQSPILIVKAPIIPAPMPLPVGEAVAELPVAPARRAGVLTLDPKPYLGV